MKFIIFACLLIYLHCYESNYSLDKYGHIYNIRGDQKGIIALDLSNFNIGDTIYLTLTYFNTFYLTFKYCFSNSKTYYNTLERTKDYYSYKHGSVSKIAYEEYYYKIKIPTTEAKANYLLIRYDFSGNSLVRLNVINTKFERFTLLKIAFSCFGFILLVIFILCLCKRRLKACYDRANPNQNNFGINNGQVSENALYPSSDNQEKLNEQNNEPEKEKIEIKDITDNNSQDNDDAPPQVDYYPTSE